MPKGCVTEHLVDMSVSVGGYLHVMFRLVSTRRDLVSHVRWSQVKWIRSFPTTIPFINPVINASTWSSSAADYHKVVSVVCAWSAVVHVLLCACVCACEGLRRTWELGRNRDGCVHRTCYGLWTCV